MKKLMIAACAVAMAAVSQAAFVDWSYTINSDTTVANATEAQASAYAKDFAVYIFKTADFNAETFDVKNITGQLDSSDIKYKGYSTRSPKGGVYATADQGGTVGNPRAIDVGNVAAVDLTYVIVDTANDKWTTEAYTSVATRGEQETGTAGVKTISQPDFAAKEWKGEAIPEPTSAMLLLLGVAGLALKRKRA